jgi:alcohol dehydrogenase
VSKYRSVEVLELGGALRLGERELVEPGFGQVRVTVEACGVCRTDSEFVAGHLPGLSFPVTPGHEVAGRIDVVGADVRRWSVGDRVTVGWSGGHCGYCNPCRRGEFVHCDEGYTTGATYPGGYAESMVVPVSALARIPDVLCATDAAPMACAGVTMFNSLRRSGSRPGDLVAILGLGGLGHLGVQFAVKMGFRTAVIARGQQKAELALRLGAHHYVDSTTTDVAAALRELGGARVGQATAANADAITATVDGLSPYGELLALAVLTDPLAISPLQLILASKSIEGHPGGTAMDVEDTLNFAALDNIAPWSNKSPLTTPTAPTNACSPTRPDSALSSPPTADRGEQAAWPGPRNRQMHAMTG